jgi:hypothetical protein
MRQGYASAAGSSRLASGRLLIHGIAGPHRTRYQRLEALASLF